MSEGLGQNSILRTRQDPYIHQFMTAVVACTRLAQDQDSQHYSQHYSMDGGRAHELQLLPVGLLSVLSEVYYANGWPHLHAYMGSTNWT